MHLFDIYFQKDERHIHNFQDDPAVHIPTPIYPHFDWWRHLFEMMAFTYEGHTSLTVEFLRFCTQTVNFAGNPIPISFTIESRDQENPYGVDISSLEWVQISSSDQCDGLFSQFLDRYGYGSIFNDIRGSESIKTLLGTLRRFENRTYPYTDGELDCLTRIEDAVNDLNLYEESVALAMKVVESPDMSTALGFSEELLTLYEEIVRPAQIDTIKKTEDLMNSCSCLDGLSNREGPRVEQDRIEMLEAYSLALETKAHFNSIKNKFNTIFNKTAEYVSPAVDMVVEYLNGNVTKLEAALLIDTNIFEKALDDIDDHSNELRENINDYEHSMAVGKEKLHNAYANLTTMQIVYLNTYVNFNQFLSVLCV